MKSLLKPKKFLVVVAVILIMTACIITIVTITSSNPNRTAAKQLSLGEKYLSELEYDKAVIAFSKAIEIEPRNIGAYLGLAEAYEGLGQDEDAIKALQDAIAIVEDAKDDKELIDNSEDVYIKLAELYEKNGEREKAFRILLEGYELTSSNKLAILLKDYYPEIEASVAPGTYTETQLLSLISSGGKIYFTRDGSEPGKTSEIFAEPIEIHEGKMTIKAAVENEFGELGEVKVYTYSIDDRQDNVIVAELSPKPEETSETPILEEPSDEILIPDEEEYELTDPENEDISTPMPTQKPTPTPTPTPAPAPISTPVPTNKDEVIVWKDAVFEEIIRGILDKPVGDIYKSDVADITELDISNLSDPFNYFSYIYIPGIKNIDDIIHFPNLTRLYIRAHNISDISALSKLTNLTELNLDVNNISDISALSKLTNLTELYLGNNNITNISALSKLTNLTKLDLRNNNISDWTPVSHVPFVYGRP